jgi:hypothetical protein
MTGTRLLTGLFSLALACAVAPLLAADPVRDPNDLAQYDQVIEPADREHWAYRPVDRPKPPASRHREGALNPIDSFIRARLEGASLRANPRASSRQLIRRVFLDVIGLPPTPDQQREWLADASVDAWPRLIDRLLADPAYGERWGRHWLDLVRYAETNGYERDAPKPQVWRYRDWVIDALNADKPYDRFVLEQLAGDELANANSESVIATGFNRLGAWDDEPADLEEDRYDQLDDIVRTTSQVFLGLTLGCARCHNHKFDALTALDYYRMAAVFDPLKRPQNGRADLDAPAIPPGAHADSDAPRAYFLQEPSSKPPITHLLHRGRAASPGPIVQAGVPAVLVRHQPRFDKSDAHTTRRRFSFARWLVDEHNPLTARVMVNRVWQYHFGRGLVKTPSDFGVMGAAPTNPELLDWLADWWMHDARWSLKKLHRLILTSATYQMSKRIDPVASKKDPENDLFWRVPYQRVEVEVLRDSMLAASGQLRRVMHGPSVHLAVPPEALAGSSDPKSIWPAFDEREAARRTVYAFVKRSLVVPMLEVLDLCDTTRSVERRNITNVPTQALTLLNGDEVNRQARRLAERLQRECGDDARRQIARAFELSVCRRPTKEETTQLQAFLAREERQFPGERRASEQSPAVPTDAANQAARIRLCRALFNLNEFAFPD